ncbi:MAG: ABC transporter permease [Caulobacteraceae bacterium]
MSKLLLIAGREYLSYVRTVGFLVSLILPPVVLGAASIIPAQMEKAAPIPMVSVLDLSDRGVADAVAAAFAGNKPVARLVPASTSLIAASDPHAAGDAARRLIEAGAVDDVAVIHGGDEGLAVDLWTRNGEDAPVARAIDDAISGALREKRLEAAGASAAIVREAETLHPRIVDFTPRAAAAGQVSMRDRLPGILGVGFAFLLWSAVTSGAGMLLNSVVEERANRILEVLASSADPIDILGGKIIGAAGLTASVLGGWAVLGLAAVSWAQPQLAADIFHVLIGQGLLLYFAAFFVGGYLAYAALFASVGAFCDTPREAQTLLGPMMLLLVIPLMCLNPAMQHPNSPALHALAWFPPFTPFLMPALAGGAPPLAEVAGAAAMLWIIAALALWGATRAFRAGIVATSKPDLWRWMGLRRKTAAQADPPGA